MTTAILSGGENLDEKILKNRRVNYVAKGDGEGGAGGESEGQVRRGVPSICGSSIARFTFLCASDWFNRH